MQLAKEPYFMSNKDWYYYVEDEGTLKLTDKAPPEAVKSQKEFYERLESQYIDE